MALGWLLNLGFGGGGDSASSTVTIRERIVRQVRVELAAMTGATEAHRWDRRGTNELESGDAIVWVINDPAGYNNQGKTTPHRYTLTLGCGVVIYQAESASEATDILVNRWKMRIENALRSNRQITEDGTNVRLAENSFIRTVNPPLFGNGASVAAVGLEVHYLTDAANSKTYGTAITAAA